MKNIKTFINYFRKSIYGSIIIIVILLYGFLGSIFIMDLNIFDAAYYTIITIATVGYGDITPVTTLQKIFTITLALSGVGLLAYILTIIISSFTENLHDIRSGRIMDKKLAEMENHYILCGCGRVGSAVLEELMKRNQKVLIVEYDEDVLEDLEENKNVTLYHANATEDRTLKKLNIEKSLGMIVTTGSDVDNLFIVLTTREMYEDAWIVSRASKKENIKRLKHAGADKIISPEVSGGVDIYFAAVEPNLVHITQKHGIEFIEREFEILKKHDCNMENIEYHFHGIKTPVIRSIGVIDEEEKNNFINKVKENSHVRESLEVMYDTVNGVHSHWISGPDKSHLEMAIKELEKEGNFLGVDLDFKEINEFTKH